MRLISKFIITFSFPDNSIYNHSVITKIAKKFENFSEANFGEPINRTPNSFPTRLEHSYFNDNVYWSLGPIHHGESTLNTTLHPRISWKQKSTSTELPISIYNSTVTRRWRWPTTSTTVSNEFPFEPLTHKYDTDLVEQGPWILLIINFSLLI